MPNPNSRLLKLVYAALFALSLTVFLGKSYEVLLRGIDSNIHAAVSMQTTSSGWLPQLPMHQTAHQNQKAEYVAFNDHPFFPFWVNGWIMRLLGPSAWSARLLTALSSVGCVFLTYALGSVWSSPVFGVAAAVILLFTRDFVLTSATMSLDTTMLFFILLSFYLWQKKRTAALGLACGFGLWIKTPLVLLVFPTAVLTSLIQGKLKNEIRPLILSGILAVLVGSIVWLWAGFSGGWPMVSDYWFRQVWGTAVEGRNAGEPRDWFFFFKTLKTGFLPFLPLLFVSGIQLLRGKKGASWTQTSVLVPLIATGIIASIVTLMKFKLGLYFTPVFPFLALLSVHGVFGFLKKYEEKFYETLIIGTPLLLGVLVTSPIPLAPEAFLSLKRFMPFIQSYGPCTDPILVIRGGEPIGSGLDYRLVINFYTNHPVDEMECGPALQRIETQAPGWIILSSENLQNCLSAKQREKYPTHLQAGNQVLLTNRIPQSDTVNLTPLERELQPSVDCKAPAYSEDRYHRY